MVFPKKRIKKSFELHREGEQKTLHGNLLKIRLVQPP